MKTIIIVLIISGCLSFKLRGKEMEERPQQDLEAFEHLIKDNQRKMEMAEKSVESLEKKWNYAMKDVTNLKKYDQKLKENVIKSMAYNETPSDMRFKQSRVMETPSTMSVPEIKANVGNNNASASGFMPMVSQFPQGVPQPQGNWYPNTMGTPYNGYSNTMGSPYNGYSNAMGSPYNGYSNAMGSPYNGLVSAQNLPVQPQSPLNDLQKQQAQLLNPQPMPATPQAANMPPAQLPYASQKSQLNNVQKYWSDVYGPTPTAVKTSTSSTLVNQATPFGGLPIQTTEVKQTLSPQNTISPVDFKRTPNGPTSMATTQTISTVGNPQGKPDIAMSTGGQAVPAGMGNNIMQASGQIASNRNGAGNSQTYQPYNMPQGYWAHPNGSVYYGNPPKGYTIYNDRGDVVNQW